jgi:hypothetical protein
MILQMNSFKSVEAIRGHTSCPTHATPATPYMLFLSISTCRSLE